MGVRRRNSVFAASGSIVLAAGLIFQSSTGFAFEAPAATAAPVQQVTAPVLAAPAAVRAAPAPTVESPNRDAEDDAGTAAVAAPKPASLSYSDLEAELECLAKVVHYESNGQPRAGQLAVAQVVINRAKSGRFPSTYCGVVHQRGQFAQVAKHRPNRSSSGWRTAVDVAREAVSGAEQPAPGAMFFHATHIAGAGFKRHDRVTRIGGHIFYR